MAECFWNVCSNSRRCREYGSCVAIAQRAAIASGAFPPHMSEDDKVKRVANAIRLADTTDEFAMARAAIKALAMTNGDRRTEA